MTQLTPANFKNDGKSASGGPYKGKQFAKIAQIKIEENRPFIMGQGPDSPKVYGKVLNKENGVTLSYSLTPGGKKQAEEKISSFLKDGDFGGMGGSRADQAKNTGPTESGCAYYCSLIFNVIKKKLVKGDDSKANLNKAAKYVKATSSLEQFLKEGPEDWHEENVYINTANEVYAKFGRKFKGTVYCHRGSAFMNNLYEAFKSAKKLDAKEDNLAPGSFNNDKWNPGDIWLSSFDPNSEPLKNCRNFTELKQCVLDYSGQNGRDPKTELLAVSLKKPGNPKKALLNEYNTKTRTNYRKGEVKYDGFSYGKTGNFFSSNDIYIYVAGKSVQFRAFNTSKSWQGNIIGTGALGGKIGGGNIDYYLRQTGIGTLGPRGGFQEVLTGQLKSKDYKLLFDLYKKYWGKQSSRAQYKNFPIIKDFATFEKMRKEAGTYFTWQKLMSMRMIDLIESASRVKANAFATELVRYAASNTDISTYFIKVE